MAYADELDARITQLLEPAQAQLREMRAFLDQLSVTEHVMPCPDCGTLVHTRIERDYRAEFLLFWAGRNIERADTKAGGKT
jgi:hypothetical protein